MLVNRRRTQRLAGDADDAGSAIVSVLIVMIVLSIFALTGAALVTNTTGSVVSTRGSVQAQAAADAGITAALAEARRTGAFCSLSLASTNPNYTVTSSCASNQVTFVSTGRGTGAGGGAQPTTQTQAVYAYTPARQPGIGADMIFFDSATFTAQVKTVATADPLTVFVPSGNITCQVPMAASIRAQGDFITKGSCDVAGSVTVGGKIDMSNGNDRVRGDLTAAGTGSSTIRGSIGGNLSAGGGAAFGWERQSVGGDVRVAGDVSLGNQRLAKSLTLPSGKTLQQQEGVVSGSIARPTTVAAPAVPTFQPWFDYAFSASDWPGYSIITLTAKGSGAGTCDSFNAHPATGWATLSALSAPTVLDARACSGLSSNSGTHPTVALKTDVILLAKSFDLTMLTVNAAPGATPDLRVIVEDRTKDAEPTCGKGAAAGNITINGTVVGSGVAALAYTPCTLDVGGIDGRDRWNGAFYGGKFDHGGTFTFTGDPIALPGMPGSTGAGAGGGAGGLVLGELVSQRDIR